jgi:membrane fusion protein (multidrug efflux system)
VEGRIVEVLFRDGSLVEENQPLFRVDDAELRTQVTRAEADRDLAAQELARQRQLMQSQSSTTSELERAEATARSSQAALDLLKLRLDRTVVRAPFAGLTGARVVSPGDFVTSQPQLVPLQAVNPMRVSIDVPERRAEAVRTGMGIRFMVAALRNREFTGTVDFVNPVVRLPARTIVVRGVVQNPRRELQPGMFAEGRLIAAVRENATVVPEDAILPLSGRTYVWVIAGDKATRRPVELGVRTPGFVELTSGVAAGDTVVVGGLERLSEGAPVRPTLIERTAPATR